MSDTTSGSAGSFHEQPRGEEGDGERTSDTSRLRDEISGHARAFADGQKDRGAAGIEKIATTAFRAADGIREEAPEVARYVERVAEKAQRLSETIRERGTGELLQEAQEFARQQPALVVGGAFVAGLILTRFFKSSAPRAGRQFDSREDLHVRD